MNSIPYNSFNTTHRDERKTGDIDIIKCIREILIRNGLKKKVEELFDTDSSIAYAQHLGPLAQRDVLASFWNLQFMNAGVGGYEERACLTLPFNDSDWIRVFVEKLIPFIVDNDLPKVLYGWKPQAS